MKLTIRTTLSALICLVCSFFFTSMNAQDSLVFPVDWQGIWKGELKIYAGDGLKQAIPMELHIQAKDSIDHYNWWIIYGEDKETGKRAYELKAVDKSKGVWMVDEKNTIAMECYFLHNKLWSRYDVMGNLITVTNEVKDNEMIFEVISGSLEPVSITGNQQHEGEDIPEVKTFPIRVMQRAVLSRE